MIARYVRSRTHHHCGLHTTIGGGLEIWIRTALLEQLESDVVDIPAGSDSRQRCECPLTLVADLTDQNRLRRIARLAKLLDAQFRFPGTKIRFGLDALIGLIPVVGDVAMVFPALFVVYLAWQAGVPRRIALRMLGNVLIDSVLGAIPVVGDLFDVAFKANMRNARLLQATSRKGHDEV